MAGIFGSKKPQSEQSPALSGLSIQTSAAGKVIPVIYGEVRIAPNLLWYANFESHEHKQEQGKGGGGGCFVAGTLVATPGGERPIEDLVEGDRIFCVDDNFEVIEGAVSGAHRHSETGDKMVRVHAGERTLYVTRGHYIYVTGVPTSDGNGVPIRAEQLVPGVHSLVDINGVLHPVSAVDDAPDVEFLYNLSVAPNENYFAGGVLVHNGGGSSKSVTYTYTADLLWGLCEGDVILPGHRVYIDKTVTTTSALGLTEGPGRFGDPTWSYLTTNYPSQAIPYPAIAWVGGSPYDLGDNANLPNFNFQVSRSNGDLADEWDAGVYIEGFGFPTAPWKSGLDGDDQSPCSMIYDILTNQRYGCGFGPQVGNIAEEAFPFTVSGTPYQQVMVGGVTGGIGAGPGWLIQVVTDDVAQTPLIQLPYRAGVDPGAGNFMATDNFDQYITQPSTNFTRYQYMGSVIGGVPAVPYVLTLQFSAADSGQDLLVTTGQLTGYTGVEIAAQANNIFLAAAYTEQRTATEVLQELADLAGGAFVWTSGLLQLVLRYGALNPSFLLTDDDFLPNQGGSGAGGGNDPLQFTRKRAADQSNIIKVEYKDRDLAYGPGVATAMDQAHIDAYGRRELGSKSAPFGNATGATYYANTLLNRQQVRTTYYFTLGAQWVFLDPMDAIAITDSALGLNQATVRILEMTENDDGTINFVAEEVVTSAGEVAPSYTTNQSSGFQPDTGADPGPVNTPIIFEAPTELTGATPEIWVAISGASALWAGARVWLSTDGGSSYENIGTQFGAARMGVLNSLPTGADPDVSHTPSVDLTESFGTLLSATMAQADLGLTLSIVDNELISYETATLTATNVYTLGYIRRALDGTVQASHTAAPFARLDSLIFKHSYPTTMIGKTIYLKFTSFNTYGSGEESLASVTAYPYTISGGGFGGGTGGVPATPTGLAATSAGP